MLWAIDWPAKGTVQSFIDHVKCYVAAKLEDQDVHLIFKGYYAYTTKSVALEDRSTCSRVHQLNRYCLVSDQNQDATEQAHF